jgi:hypothetical protein
MDFDTARDVRERGYHQVVDHASAAVDMGLLLY